MLFIALNLVHSFPTRQPTEIPLITDPPWSPKYYI